MKWGMGDTVEPVTLLTGAVGTKTKFEEYNFFNYTKAKQGRTRLNYVNNLKRKHAMLFLTR